MPLRTRGCKTPFSFIRNQRLLHSICLLSIGGRPDRLQVLLHSPVAGSLQAGRVEEGFRFLGARLGVEDIDGVHVVVLATDVLVHENGRQTWPNHCSTEGAQLDHIAEALWACLRSSEELVGNDHELADAAGHGDGQNSQHERS